MIQSKPEAEPETYSEPVQPVAEKQSFDSLYDSMNSTAFMADVAPTDEEEEETRALLALTEKAASSTSQKFGGASMAAGGGVGGRLGMGMGRGAGIIRRNMPNVAPPAGYQCRRCGQSGHYIQHCPSNSSDLGAAQQGNAAAAGTQKILGIPTASLVVVKDLEGVDTSGKVVKSTKGGYEILLPSEVGQKTMLKQGGSGINVTNIDMSLVEDRLKCPLSKKMLRDAVRMVCCHKVVCDSAIREALFSTSDFRCPLCGQIGITPDELRPDYQIRQAVEDYLMSLDKRDNESSTVPSTEQSSFSGGVAQPQISQGENPSIAPSLFAPSTASAPQLSQPSVPAAQFDFGHHQHMESGTSNAAVARPPPPPGPPPQWTGGPPPAMQPAVMQQPPVMQATFNAPPVIPMHMGRNAMPIPMVFDFPPPLTREEFRREQNAQLEARRRERELENPQDAATNADGNTENSETFRYPRRPFVDNRSGGKVLCRIFQSGNCRFGSNCRFSHETGGSSAREEFPSDRNNSRRDRSISLERSQRSSTSRLTEKYKDSHNYRSEKDQEASHEASSTSIRNREISKSSYVKDDREMRERSRSHGKKKKKDRSPEKHQEKADKSSRRKRSTSAKNDSPRGELIDNRKKRSRERSRSREKYKFDDIRINEKSKKFRRDESRETIDNSHEDRPNTEKETRPPIRKREITDRIGEDPRNDNRKKISDRDEKVQRYRDEAGNNGRPSDKHTKTNQRTVIADVPFKTNKSRSSYDKDDDRWGLRDS